MNELSQAIRHCIEVSTSCEDPDCAEQHKQLARWLVELAGNRSDAPENRRGHLTLLGERVEVAMARLSRLTQERDKIHQLLDDLGVGAAEDPNGHTVFARLLLFLHRQGVKILPRPVQVVEQKPGKITGHGGSGKPTATVEVHPDGKVSVIFGSRYICYDTTKVLADHVDLDEIMRDVQVLLETLTAAKENRKASE